MKAILNICGLFYFLLLAVSMQNLFAQTPQRVRVTPNALTDKVGRPQVAINQDGIIFVLWDENNDPSPNSIWLSRSDDGGLNFQNPVLVTDTSARPRMGIELVPAMAVDKDTIYVIWNDLRDGTNDLDVYFSRSTNGGQNFSIGMKLNIDSSGVFEFQPYIVKTSSGILIASWQHESANMDAFIEVKRSPDGGNNWEDALFINNPGAITCSCCHPWLSASDNSDSVYVLWRNNNSNIRDIYMSVSPDAGTTWGNATQISFGNWFFGACPSSGPRGVFSNGVFNYVWSDGRTGPQQIYFNSTSFASTNAELLSTNASVSFSTRPVITASPADLFASWEESGSASIGLSYSMDGGQNWSYDFLSPSPSNEVIHAPSVVYNASNGYFHIVWTEEDNASMNGDIYFLAFNDFNSLGIEGTFLEKESVKIYPNPFSTSALLQITNIDELRMKDIEFVMYDLLGREGKRFTIYDSQCIINRDGLSSGMYFYKAIYGKGQGTNKILTTGKIVIQ